MTTREIPLDWWAQKLDRSRFPSMERVQWETMSMDISFKFCLKGADSAE